MRRRLLFLICLLMIAVGCGAGWFLVQNNPEKSDVIVVPNGGTDARYLKGLELLRSGYGKTLFWDARSDTKFYGHTPAELAEPYMKSVAADMLDQVKVCPTQYDSTLAESDWITKCMQSVGAKSALVVTSEYHTRRALSILRKAHPEYRWTVAAANEPYIFGVKWWQHREWAKTTLDEWEKLAWWELVERWRT